MKAKVALAVVLVVAILGVLAAVKVLQFQKLAAGAKAMAQPPETVSSVVVREEKWQRTVESIGTVAAVQGVTIAPEVAGTVREIAFESGALVARNDLLASLDTSTERAQLRAYEAQADLAVLNVGRVAILRTNQTVSQSELDTAEATLKQYQAASDAVRTVIDKKTIRAPFAGVLGFRQVNLGQYLDPGKPIVTLQSLTPIYADFSLPQQELARLKTGMRVRVRTDAYPARAFEGALSAIGPEVDPSTRSVPLRATLDNPDQALRPGMFVRVEVLLPEETPVLVVPQTSVLSEPYGDSVFVVESKAGENGKPGLAVRQQVIRPGPARGDLMAVESGLKAGERIVGAGVFKLRNGMAVVENNTLAPKNDAAPRPADI